MSTYGLSTNKSAQHPQQPWYDEECKTIRKQLRDVPFHDPNYRILCKHYHSAKRRKRRHAQLQNQKQMCELAVKDAAKFWRQYRQKDKTLGNISNEQWHEAFRGLFGKDVVADPAPPSGDQGLPTGLFPELDQDVDVTEVAAAFRRLKRNKAAGIDGIKAEFIIDARDILLQPLATTFTQMLSHGVPDSWCLGVIHPIFKSGDCNDPSNYRGITVTSVLAKLFAMVIEARLSNWAETNNLRATGQAGFRKDHRTADNIFIMNALITQAKKDKKKLYCCFVDFKKAFDSVPRQRLWQVLASCGVTNKIISCLQSIYSRDKACVLTQEGLTESFECTAGVKQGCPVSPLLFGMYIDEIERLLNDAKDQIDAPFLMGTLVAILLFADDIAMFAYSAKGLQAQLSILQQFCKDRGLDVNVSKTKIVVFEARKTDAPSFFYNTQAIEQVQKFKYLGIVFHSTRGLSCAIDHLTIAARKALFGMYARCHALHIHDPALKCRLFDALVRPVMSYTSEIWTIVGGKSAIDSMERLHTGFLKRLLGVPSNTCTNMLYAEFGRLPITHFCLQQSLRYLERLIHLDDSRLCKKAFFADAQDGLGWWKGMAEKLHEHGLEAPRLGEEIDFGVASKQLERHSVEKCMAPGGSSLQQTYYQIKTEFKCEPYITQAKNHHLRRQLALFRTGSHWLKVRHGRFEGLPYDDRVCPSCCTQVDNEWHALFVCPVYDQHREHFADLFQTTHTIKSFLEQNCTHRLALFLTACRGSRLAKAKRRQVHHDRARWPDLDLAEDLDVGLASMRTLAHDSYDSS